VTGERCQVKRLAEVSGIVNCGAEAFVKAIKRNESIDNTRPITSGDEYQQDNNGPKETSAHPGGLRLTRD
jgi:hypothetical protein